MGLLPAGLPTHTSSVFTEETGAVPLCTLTKLLDSGMNKQREIKRWHVVDALHIL